MTVTESAREERQVPLQIRLFGTFQAERSGASLPGLHRRDGKQLLAYLVLHQGEEMPYRTLAEHFFPAEARTVAEFGGDFSSTRQAIRYLRMALGPDAYRLASVSKGVVRLDLTGADVDIFLFDRAARSSDPEDWERAIALYRGPLLEDWPEPWSIPARHRRQRDYERLVRLLEQRRAPSGSDLTFSSPPNNLPVMMSAFIGRTEQIEDIRKILTTNRLLTLCGSGGCGKTRLALQVASLVTDHYRDGILFIELAPLSDGILVPQALAQALGIREKAEESIQQSVIEYLKSKHLLLIVDNCEHLLSSCATLLAGILRACPNVRVLATSRERLNIAGEVTYRVPSLSFPVSGQRVTTANLNEFESVRLFIERARLHKPDFVPIPRNAAAIARICSRLDGIPLAIELAAARVRSLASDEIDRRLDDRFRLLVGGDSTALPRQQTLRALIDWSYQLLTGAEKLVFARLSVFAGSWTLEAAEQVCAGQGIDARDVLDLLTGLCDKSLVEVRDESRYRMLETIRQYSVERLAEQGETEALNRRHLIWSLKWVETNAPGLFEEDQEVLQRFEQEHDNLRTAVARSLITTGEEETALRLTAGLSRFRFIRGYFSEGRDDLEKAIRQTTAPTPALAPALLGLGRLIEAIGERRLGQSYIERSCALYTQAGDTHGRAHALLSLSTVLFHQGDYARMRPPCEESLALFRILGNRWGIGASLGNLAISARSLGRYEEARVLFAECLTVFRALSNRQGIAQALENSSDLEVALGNLAEARSLLEECLVTFRTLGNLRAVAYRQADLAMVLLAQGDLSTARKFSEESLALTKELGISFPVIRLAIIARHADDNSLARQYLIESLRDTRQESHAGQTPPVLREVGYYLQWQGDYDKAVRLWGAQAKLLDNLYLPLSPSDQQEYNRHIAQVRSEIGENAFAKAWEQGSTLSAEQAIDFALEILSAVGQTETTTLMIETKDTPLPP